MNAKDRQIRRRIVIGTASNYAGQVLAYAVLFFLTPFIVRHLGPAAYGLWVLLSSVVAYGSVLDLGIWAAVIKYVSEFQARDEEEKTRQLVRNALWLYLGLGAALFVLILLIAPFVPLLFDIPAGQQQRAVWLTMLMGLGAGLSLPGMAPLSALRGLQRYELVNLVEAIGALFAAIVTVVVLSAGGGIAALIVINMSSVGLMHLLGLLAVRRAAPEIRWGWGRPRLQYTRTLLGYSWPLFIKDIALRLQTKTDELTVGIVLSVAAVTPYSLARRLSDATQILAWQFVKVLLPLASELDAEKEHRRLRLLYTTGTRLAIAISLIIGVTLIILAGPLLAVWIGPEYSQYSSLVVVLVVAQLIITSQRPASTVLQGTARHRLLAATSLFSGMANLGLSLLLGRTLGLIGVALGTLIPSTIEHLGIIMPYTMRELGVGAREALRHIYAPALLPALPMALVQVGISRWLPMESYLGLAFCAGAGAITYSLIYVGLAASPPERRAYRELLAEVMKLLLSRQQRHGERRA